MIMCVMTWYKNKILWFKGMTMKAIKAKIEKVNEKLLMQIHINGNRAFAVKQTIYRCLIEKYKK